MDSTQQEPGSSVGRAPHASFLFLTLWGKDEGPGVDMGGVWNWRVKIQNIWLSVLLGFNILHTILNQVNSCNNTLDDVTNSCNNTLDDVTVLLTTSDLS